MPDYTQALAFINRLNDTLGKCLCWLAALMAVTVVGVVILRTFFATGSVAAQESVTYMHATMFLLCLPYAAQNDAHVRVDIFYRNWPPLGKSWVNLLGSLIFLLPFSLFLIVVSWPFALTAWSISESSINPGGIPAVFLLKALIPLSGVLLLIYGLTEAIRHLIDISCITEDNAREQ